MRAIRSVVAWVRCYRSKIRRTLRLLASIAALGMLALMATGASAQWLKLPTPGFPRLPDGKPNLSAPAPRTADGKPDFSGIWDNDGGDRLYNNMPWI